MSQTRVLLDSPFFGPEFANMSIVDYAKQYTKLGLICIFNYDQPKASEFQVCSSLCYHAWVYLLCYSTSIFVV